MVKDRAPSESNPACSLVAIADGDSATRTSLLRGLEKEGFACRPYPTGGDLLEGLEFEQPDCILLDIRIPETGGLAVLKSMPSKALAIPVIVLIAEGEFALAAEAMRAGAVDFQERPVSFRRLGKVVGNLIERSAGLRRQAEEIGRSQSLVAQLTPRENEISSLVVAGSSNKEIGLKLGISPRTVEVHRAHIFKKLNVRNAIEFALVFEKAKLLPHARR